MNNISPDIILNAVDQSTNGILITDPNQEDNPIIYANKVVLDMTGYSAEELSETNCRILQGADTKQKEVAILKEKISNEESVQVTIRNYKKDGTLFWNELSITPVKDKESKVTHFIGVQKDVTEIVEAHNKILALNEELKQLNSFMTERELKMVELKAELARLKESQSEA